MVSYYELFLRYRGAAWRGLVQSFLAKTLAHLPQGHKFLLLRNSQRALRNSQRSAGIILFHYRELTVSLSRPNCFTDVSQPFHYCDSHEPRMCDGCATRIQQSTHSRATTKKSKSVAYFQHSVAYFRRTRRFISNTGPRGAGSGPRGAGSKLGSTRSGLSGAEKKAAEAYL